MTQNRLREILHSFSNRHILVIGDLMLDHYLWGVTRRISPEAPVPIVNIESETHRPGGAANVAYNLRVLGAHVTAAGIIGQDNNGEHLKTALTRESIDLSGIVETPHRPTTSKTRIMGHTQYRQQQQMMRIDREVTHPITGKLLHQLRDAIARTHAPDAIFVSDYAKGVVTPDLMDTVRRNTLPHHRRSQGPQLRQISGRHRHLAQPIRKHSAYSTWTIPTKKQSSTPDIASSKNTKSHRSI